MPEVRVRSSPIGRQTKLDNDTTHTAPVDAHLESQVQGRITNEVTDARFIELSELEASLRMRESLQDSLLQERDLPRTVHAKLDTEHKRLKMMYEKSQHHNRLADEVCSFIARDGQTVNDSLSELMLARPLKRERVRRLSQIATDLTDLRTRVIAQHAVSWRPAPTRNMGSPAARQIKTPPPVPVGMPYNSPAKQTRRSQSAALIRPQLLTPSVLPADAFLPSPNTEAITGQKPVRAEGASPDSQLVELRRLLHDTQMQLAVAAQDRSAAERDQKAAEDLCSEAERRLQVNRNEFDQEIQRLKFELAVQKDTNQAELASMKQELLANSESKREQVKTLTLTFEEQLAERARLQSRQERVELMHRQSTRRMLHQALSKGWIAWLEAWECHAYAHMRLHHAAVHLWKPELAKKFYFWLHDWRECAYAQDRMKREEDFGNYVAALCRQFARRLAQQGLAYAWTSWREMWQSRRYALSLLRQAANHFAKPEIVRGFEAWLDFNEQSREQAEWVAQQRRERDLLNGKAILDQKLQHLKLEYEQKLKKFEESKLIALERQRVELTGTAVERAALKEQEAKEHRVEQLRMRWVRRMMQQSLAFAWSSWLELWQAKTYAFALLRQAANNFAKPEIVRGFEAWLDFNEQSRIQARWVAQQQRENQLLRSQGALQKQLEHVRAECEQKLKKFEESKLIALERQRVELIGTAVERAALKEQEAKEHRVEQLRMRWVRRMMQQSLAFAWSSWLELWQAKTYAFALLRQAANNFAKPEIARGFAFWLAYVEQQHHLQDQRRQLGLEARCASLEQQLSQKEAYFEQRLQAAENERQRLLQVVKRLDGNAHEAETKMEAIRAQERLERVEFVKRQIARRIMNRVLALGWTVWVESWEARTYAKTRLSEVASRLRKPVLSWAFSMWMADLQEAHQAAAVHTIKDRLALSKKQLEEDLRQARHELGQHKMKQAAHTDEVVALRDKVRGLTEEVSANASRLAEADLLRREHAEMERRHRLAKASMSTAEASRAQAERDLNRQREDQQKLLERLLQEQRKTFEAELDQLRREADLLKLQRGQMERDVSSREDELNRQISELTQQLDRAEMFENDLNEQSGLLEAENMQLTQQLAAQTARREEVEDELKKLKREKYDLKEKIAQLEFKEKQAIIPSPKVDERKSPNSDKRESQRTRRSTGPLGNIDLDESPGAPPISDQIKDALHKNSTRVVDLFRNWDTDGDGSVTRHEFHRAMTMLGLEVPKMYIDEIYDEWDIDGGGELGINELTKILRAKRHSISTRHSSANQQQHASLDTKMGQLSIGSAAKATGTVVALRKAASASGALRK